MVIGAYVWIFMVIGLWMDALYLDIYGNEFMFGVCFVEDLCLDIYGNEFVIGDLSLDGLWVLCLDICGYGFMSGYLR